VGSGESQYERTKGEKKKQEKEREGKNE